MAKPAKPGKKYVCTQCGGDAFVAMTGWKGPQGVIVKKNERLCLPCSRRRGIDFSFHKDE